MKSGTKRWDIEETKILTDNYKTKSDVEISIMLNREVKGVESKRKSLGLKREIKKFVISKNMYNEAQALLCKDMTLKNIAKELGVPYHTLIAYKSDFGITSKNNNWTIEDIELLKIIYENSEWDYILEKLKGRTKDGIRAKASELKIKKKNYFWSNDDLKKSIDMYNSGKTVNEIYELLNHTHSVSAITTKLLIKEKNNIKLHKTPWTKDELDILINNYETTTMEETCKLLPNRTKNAIIRISCILNLNKPTQEWKKEEDEILINMYETTNDYDISLLIGRTRRSVKWRRQGLGLECHFYNNHGNAYPASDGTMCLSFAELEITNYLIEKHVNFKKEVTYSSLFESDTTKRRVDWAIYSDENEFMYAIEYFGIYDLKRSRNKIRTIYIKHTRKKIKDLYKYGVIDQCVFIFPGDLKNKTLDEIFYPYVNINPCKTLLSAV